MEREGRRQRAVKPQPCGFDKARFIGTSQAAPHVSGLAALLDSKYLGGLNPAQLEAKIQQCSDDLGSAGADPDFGQGRINAFKTMNEADCNNSSP
jgi:subtilisin family serine protease